MIFKFITRTKQHFPVRKLCGLLGVSESGFYAFKSRPQNNHARRDQKLLVHIRTAFAAYGSPRMVYELRDQVLMLAGGVSHDLCVKTA